MASSEGIPKHVEHVEHVEHEPTVQHERIMVLLKAARRQILEQPNAHGWLDDCDRKFSWLATTLKFLSKSAGAQWSNSFNKMFQHVHSISVCHTNLQSKQVKRQREYTCDACGRFEHGCPYELNIAGSLSFTPDAWWVGLSAGRLAWGRFDGRDRAALLVLADPAPRCCPCSFLINRTVRARAADLRDSGQVGSFANNLRRFFTRFFKCYVRRKGYREGGYGFMIAVCAGLYPLISHLKAVLEDADGKPKGQGA